METGIGVWIFSQTFSERRILEKKYYVLEWLLYSLIFFGIYNFSVSLWQIDKKIEKYVIFVHRRGEVKIRASLSTVEKELNSKEFIISDRGYLANIQHVMKMKGRDLYMRDGNIITVGRERFKGVREAILNYWGV